MRPVLRQQGLVTTRAVNEVKISRTVPRGGGGRKAILLPDEVRAHLGVETQRQWNDQAISRTTPALLGLFSIVILLANSLYRHSGDKFPTRTAAWYTKEKVTFSEALARVRRELWKKTVGMSVSDRDRPKRDHGLFQRFAELLCYAQ